MLFTATLHITIENSKSLCPQII